MKTTTSRILVFIIVAIYLVVPLKNHFLNTLHFFSHILSHENPYHHHGHHFHDHGHVHGILERISFIMEEHDHGDEHPVPASLTTYEFQLAFPSCEQHLPEIFPFIIDKSLKLTKAHAFPFPFFKVPTPPP
ncbi:MAG: hypothetical protein GXO86_05030 [Chlorobi bacterium]|nr:hypothetical protein [Chlorobiota bacterium]